MTIINSIAVWVMKKRLHQIELFMKYPYDVQQEVFLRLLQQSKDTQFGIQHDFKNITTYLDFKNSVPLNDYESLKINIDKIRKGEQNILWSSDIKWFAKSSGTTSDKSKFLPVSIESLEECHYKGGKDMVSLYCANIENAQLFTGKSLSLGGSHDIFQFENHESYYGDVSAIIMENLPLWAEFLRAPNLQIALMSEWESKLDMMAKNTLSENVTSLAGVPSWMMILLGRLIDLSKKENIKELWPNLEVYFHGGVNFTPYKSQFKNILGNDVNYMETFTASEGFFGIQNDLSSDDLLLMLDYGIYYEFIPQYENESKEPINLESVNTETNYAIVISTNAGLWRYQLGDTIKFTSLNPYKFKITGRTKYFINAFGEELIAENAEKALLVACEKTNSIITEYTVAPVFFDNKEIGAHQWLIEFTKEPESLEYFTEILDNALKSSNSDYEAKRYGNFVLKAPIIIKAKENVFYNWLKSKNKLGGQFKVPRLANHRQHMEELLAIQHA